MVNAIRKQAKSRGILLTRMKNGKRKYKTDNELLNEIIKQEKNIVLKHANQAKNMIHTCKSIMAVINRKSRPLTHSPPRKLNKPPPPPSPLPKFNKPPPPPPPPPKLNKSSLKNSLMSELKAFQTKKGLKNKYNKNAKITIT